MSDQLISNIIQHIQSKNLPCSKLSKPESVGLIQRVAIQFRLDLSSLYVWEGIKAERVVSYGDSIDEWEKSISLFLRNFAVEIYLVVTDDEFYPWTIFKCNKECIVRLLSDLQFFEFFIFDDLMCHILFDNHENKLIFA